MSVSKDRGVVWITGAGKGIGRALALKLANDGWIVAASARTKTDLLTLSALASGNRIHGFPLDVTDLQKTQRIIADVEAKLGPISLAIFNAGTHFPISVSEFSVDIFRDLFETNLMGPVNGLSGVLSRFIKRQSGHIVLVSSVAGYCGLPTAAAYGATKAGLINMCESLKPELERHGIKIQIINPGFVDTPLTKRNEFSMPFLITAQDAAEHIVRGLRKSAFEIAFPYGFVLLMKILRMLPYRLFFLISRQFLPR